MNMKIKAAISAFAVVGLASGCASAADSHSAPEQDAVNPAVATTPAQLCSEEPVFCIWGLDQAQTYAAPNQLQPATYKLQGSPTAPTDSKRVLSPFPQVWNNPTLAGLSCPPANPGSTWCAKLSASPSEEPVGWKAVYAPENPVLANDPVTFETGTPGRPIQCVAAEFTSCTTGQYSQQPPSQTSATNAFMTVNNLPLTVEVRNNLNGLGNVLVGAAGANPVQPGTQSWNFRGLKVDPSGVGLRGPDGSQEAAQKATSATGDVEIPGQIQRGSTLYLGMYQPVQSSASAVFAANLVNNLNPESGGPVVAGYQFSVNAPLVAGGGGLAKGAACTVTPFNTTIAVPTCTLNFVGAPGSPQRLIVNIYN